MGLLDFTLPTEASASDPEDGSVTAPSVWIVEDEPAAAELAADLCIACGARPRLFRSPLPFLRAFRDGGRPQAVVLDWRLERELSAALFLATRHRFPTLPVVFWTGSPDTTLPAAVREDPKTRIVDKAAGTDAFDSALAWALQATHDR
jgi:FixJ family two-component response regulator